ncbi:ABC transporter ATP-binding protein [Serinibacter salmoneus]|uniref:ABC-2 type transport system ATP-binding protein n=1 Tax=Serinibacter salmoneus TaxID=556530 RepID=A0A2A9CZA9_9MICO|nr:ABC transporter ATP-binding protein [Serinibacter salmoneus]PFG19461.1 ABC-2 type transport system ATP-binding protein [Serinibacter salmoneus]
MPTPALEITDLTVRYGTTTAVAGLTLAAQAGSVTAVLGPNGAGKTTTIECAEGLRPFQGGTIRVLGHSPGSLQARARVGVMLQDAGLPLGRRVKEVLHLAGRVHDRPLPIDPLVEELDLGAVLTTPVRRLSGGQRQRLALALALIGRPSLAFLDEPSAGMDPHARAAAWATVRRLRQSGCAVVLTTHHLDEAEELADEIHILQRGALLASGTAPELIARYAASGSVEVVLDRRLTPDQAADLADAMRPATTRAEADRWVLAAASPADVPALIAACAAWCADQGCAILRLTSGGGTLEHAYLRATDRAQQDRSMSDGDAHLGEAGA